MNGSTANLLTAFEVSIERDERYNNEGSKAAREAARKKIIELLEKAEALPDLLDALVADETLSGLNAERSEIYARLNDRHHSTVESIRIDRERLESINLKMRNIQRQRHAAIHKAKGE